MTATMTETFAWSGSVLDWTRKFVRKSAWKFAPDYDFDDLMQEAWLIHDKVSRRYAPGSAEEAVGRAGRFADPALLMDLYMTAVRNRFQDLADKLEKRRTVSMSEPVGDENEATLELLAEAPTDQTLMLRALIEEAPAEFRPYLRLLLSEGGPVEKTEAGLRETRVQHFARMAGTNEADLPGFLASIRSWARKSIMAPSTSV